jgi:hypothetical protein
MGKTLSLAPRDPEVLTRVLRDSAARVFALPDGQADLQWLGLQLSEARLPGVSGIATVDAGWRCDAVTTHWADAPSIAAARSPVVTIASPSLRAGHGIVVYAAVTGPRHPSLVGDQPRRAGFQEDVYDASNDSDRRTLEAIDREDHVPPRFAESFRPFVARLDLWRAPGLPAVLPIRFSDVPTTVVARSASATDADWICPAFPYDVHPVRVEH